MFRLPASEVALASLCVILTQIGAQSAFACTFSSHTEFFTPPFRLADPISRCAPLSATFRESNVSQPALAACGCIEYERCSARSVPQVKQRRALVETNSPRNSRPRLNKTMGREGYHEAWTFL